MRTILYEHERRTILDRDKGNCLKCGSRATQVDHILPQALGGGIEDFNLQSLCKRCHDEKTVQQDNLHNANRWDNREERVELGKSARARSREYEAHDKGECDEYECRFCNNQYREIREEKFADREARYWMNLDEQPRYLCDDEGNPYLDRIAVLISYIAYSDNQVKWLDQLKKWIRADKNRIAGFPPGVHLVTPFPLGDWILEAVNYLYNEDLQVISSDNALLGSDGSFRDEFVRRKVREADNYYNPIEQGEMAL